MKWVSWKSLLVALFVALPFFVPLTPPHAAKTDPTTQRAIDGLQQFYSQIKDFTADFQQIFTRTRLKRSSKESGRFFFRKPGMMRFQYAKPERKDFVYNGQTLWMYNADDEEVKVRQKVERTLYFAVIPGTFQIRETIYVDPAGNRNRFIFSNVRTNRGLPEALFTFRVPKGVQVVQLP